jgi:hypothetical protein
MGLVQLSPLLTKTTGAITHPLPEGTGVPVFQRIFRFSSQILPDLKAAKSQFEAPGKPTADPGVP